MENKERIAFIERLIREFVYTPRQNGVETDEAWKWIESEYPILVYTIYRAGHDLDDDDYNRLIKEFARILDEPLRLHYLEVAVKDLLEPTQYLVKDNQHLVKDNQHGK